MTLKDHIAPWCANRALLWLNGKSWKVGDSTLPSDKAMATFCRLLIVFLCHHLQQFGRNFQLKLYL